MRSVLTACLLLCSVLALAQSEDKDPSAIVELGGATSWNVKGGAATFGPDFAVEFTPIENWLEIEAGTTPFITHNSTEWDTDLLFKKPWTISRKAEFMLGVGPEWVHTRENGTVNQLRRRRDCRGFHVLARRKAQVRLVFRTSLRLQFRARPRAINWHERRPSHCNSVTAIHPRPLGREYRPTRYNGSRGKEGSAHCSRAIPILGELWTAGLTRSQLNPVFSNIYK